MVGTKKQHTAAEEVRELARQGRLAQYFREASAANRRQLRAGAFEIAWPLVFQRITRPVERRRGHHVCAVAMQRLAPDCLDHFHDDVDSVLDDLFAHADVPIENLEGWLTMRMRRATVDGYRRRRGRRGAPQRPRVPSWLAEALGGDAWLVELAKAILDWAGTEATAGNSLWPLAAWSQRRVAARNDHSAGESVVAAEVEAVLAAMRRRATWYEKNVERPLGRKQAPVHCPSRTSSGGHAEPEPLVLVERHEKDDALLLELASRAIALMERRVAAGEDVHVVATEVLEAVFGAVPVSHDLDCLPGHEPAGPDQVVALISDPERLRRVVASVVGLLQRRGRPSER